MTRPLLTLVAAMALLAGAARPSAHEEFRVIGTITKHQASTITVKSKDAKTALIRLDKQTVITRDKSKVDASELKVGRSVVVDAYGDSEADLLALEIRIVPTIRATSAAQIILGAGRPPVHPAYWYTDRDASVRFDVTPKDTAVYVDGHYAGLVRDYDGVFRRLHTSPGGHEITLYLEGYRTYSQRTYLTVEKARTIRRPMKRLASSEVSEHPQPPLRHDR